MKVQGLFRGEGDLSTQKVDNADAVQEGATEKLFSLRVAEMATALEQSNGDLCTGSYQQLGASAALLPYPASEIQKNSMNALSR